MKNSQTDLRLIRRTEQRRDAFVGKYSRAFNGVVNSQIDELKPYLGDIALGILQPAVMVNKLFTPESYERTYQRLYLDVGGTAAKYARTDLTPQKSYNIRSTKQEDDPGALFTALAPEAFDEIPDSILAGVQRFLMTYGGSRIKTINDTTKKLALRVIQDILAQGIEEGLSADEVGRLLERNVPVRMRAYNFRGGTIARTEILSAYSLGEMQQVQDLDLGIRKYWMARLDGRERQTHGDAYLNYRNNPINVQEDFIVGGEFMQRPGDPNGGAAEVINCRCVLGYKRG